MRALLASVLVLLALPMASAPTGAASDSVPGAGTRALPAGAQASLEAEAIRFARAWASGDTGTLARMMLREGIRLRLQRQEHVGISPRQARASLDAFLENRSGGRTAVSRVSLVAGDSSQGFAEIQWSPRAMDAAGAATFTLFVAFAREDEAWAVTEIRVLS